MGYVIVSRIIISQIKRDLYQPSRMTHGSCQGFEKPRCLVEVSRVPGCERRNGYVTWRGAPKKTAVFLMFPSKYVYFSVGET